MYKISDVPEGFRSHRNGFEKLTRSIAIAKTSGCILLLHLTVRAAIEFTTGSRAGVIYFDGSQSFRVVCERVVFDSINHFESSPHLSPWSVYNVRGWTLRVSRVYPSETTTFCIRFLAYFMQFEFCESKNYTKKNQKQETQTRENRMRPSRMTWICRAIYFNNLHIKYTRVMCNTNSGKSWPILVMFLRKTWSPVLLDVVKIEEGSISGTPCVFCGDNDADGAFFVGVLGTRTRATRPQFATSYDAYAHHTVFANGLEIVMKNSNDYIIKLINVLSQCLICINIIFY